VEKAYALARGSVRLMMESMKTHKLVLTGYEHDDINSFVKKLEKNRVKFLIDVRELPLSRKKYFSKNGLTSKVEDKKIEYIHYGVLGSPRDIRRKLRNHEMSYADFFFNYRKHILENKGAIFEIAKLLEERDICLMCYEEATEQCHRSILVDELQKILPNLRVQNI
jgi:uncharacterized protein (DUF488 family)